jgi:hypothetical protein
VQKVVMGSLELSVRSNLLSAWNRGKRSDGEIQARRVLTGHSGEGMPLQNALGAKAPSEFCSPDFLLTSNC